MFDFLQVIDDALTPCSYLEHQIARMPMCLPVRPLAGADFDRLMEAGYRRSGSYFYNTQCPNCSACEPIRLDVTRFHASRSQRRVQKRAADLRFEINPPSVDDTRVQLFNLHRRGRNLSKYSTDINAEEFRSFLLGAPVASLELSIWRGKQLLSISITDIGSDCLSAVYCCFDPRYADYSLGTLSILKQIEMAATIQMRWLYLGLYVAENKHLCYKANFKPHQRRVQEHWQDFE
jgi:leucyl-tRNA---protein transferase